MVAVKEKVNTPIISLIQINDNMLLEYLRDFDIARELFDVSMVKNNNDKVVMKRYYDSKLKRANVLVIEDEFVGITYKNLEIIKDLLDENKLVMKR